jgi:hypothetical protein
MHNSFIQRTGIDNEIDTYLDLKNTVIIAVCYELQCWTTN